MGHMEHMESAAKLLAIILSLTSGLSGLPLPDAWSAESANHKSGSVLPVHNPTSWLYSLFLYTRDLAPLFIYLTDYIKDN